MQAVGWRFPSFQSLAEAAVDAIEAEKEAAEARKNDGAEDWFNKANELKLPSDSEKAMDLLQLANINANKGKWNQANIYFQQVKKLKVSEPQMKEQIKNFEKAYNQRGQAAHLRSGQAIRAGGKRRRPKMR